VTPPAVLVRKELRAVAPLAAGCLAVMVAGTLTNGFWSFALLTYLAGSMAVGASLVGHEIAHSMLGPLLAQPVARARILAIKYLVGALVLAVLSAAALFLRLPSVLWTRDFRPDAGFVLLVFTTALFVAPWLTLLTRHALAGTVGALVSPAVLAQGLAALGIFDGDTADRFRSVGWALIALSAIAAVHGWHLFTRRLEDIDSRHGQIQLSLAVTSSDRSTTRLARAARLRSLVDKEIRLQQLPLVIAGLYLGASLLASLTTDIVPAEIDPRQDVTIWLYAGTMALLIGAVASAEERQMGVMPWQVIVPLPAWRQFALKTGVAVGLSLVLTNGVPVLVAGTTTADTGGIYPFAWSSTFLLTTTGLTLAGLYVSSLSTSSVRALVGALLLLAGLGAAYLAGQGLGGPVGTFAYDATHPWSASLLAAASELPRRTIERRAMSVMGVLAGILVAVAWRFALANHSRAEDTRARAWRQGVVLAVAVMAGSLSVSSVVAAVRFGAAPRGTISGVVVDPDGVPAANVLVRTAERRFVAGDHWLLLRGMGTLTDSRGLFRVTNLPEGEYVPIALTGVFVDLRGLGHTGVGGFAPTFSPRTTDATKAEAVAVDGRTEVGGLRIELVRAPTARLSGRLTDRNGQAFTRSGDDGHYEFEGVPPGEYLLDARPSRPPGHPSDPTLHSWRELTVTGSDMPGLDLQMETGATIRGRITFEGNGLRGASEHIRVRARQTDLIGTGSRGARVAQDWTFELEGLVGSYVFRPDILADLVVNRADPRASRYRVENPAWRWTLKAVRLDTRDITDVPLVLAPGDEVDGLELVLTDEVGRISGTVRRSEGRPGRVPVILVFAADSRQWALPARYETTFPLDRVRAFRTKALPPGDYLVVALGSRSGLTLDDPELLEELRPLATPVHLEAGETVELTLEIVR